MKSKKISPVPAIRSRKKIGECDFVLLKNRLEQLRQTLGFLPAPAKKLPTEYTAPAKDYHVERDEITNPQSQAAAISP